MGKSRHFIPAGIAAVLALLTCPPAVSAPPGPEQAPIEASRIANLAGVFVDGTEGPDFTLVVAAKLGGPNRDVTRTVRRHGAWMRIDEVDGVRRSTEWVHLTSGTVVERGESPDGPVRYLNIRRLEPQRDGMDYRSFKTGRRQSVAGEACQEWDVYRGSGFHRIGCVTADGIEVSHWSVSEVGQTVRFPATATSISRTPVKATDVEPPREVFDLKSWLPKTRRRGPDFEVVLASIGRETRTIRQHEGWQYVENKRADGSRYLTSQLADAGLWFRASIDRNGAPQQLDLSWGPPRAAANETLLRPGETVLGVPCVWYDTMPSVSDAGQHECRTADGVVLEIVQTNWGSSQRFVTVRVDRKRQSLEAVFPAAELLDLKRWIGPGQPPG